MSDSEQIIDGQVVPYSGGRMHHDTESWRDATELELKQQARIGELEEEVLRLCFDAAPKTDVVPLVELGELSDLLAIESDVHQRTGATDKSIAYAHAKALIDVLIAKATA